MKKMLLLLLALLLLCGAAQAEDAPYQLGDRMEDFSFTTYDGQTTTLYEILEEKDMVLLNFWASWCGPCKREFPHMEQAYSAYQDQVEIVALSVEVEDTTEVIKAFAESMNLSFAMGQDTERLANRFGVTSIPVSVVVDRFGTICFLESGSIPDTNIFTRLFESYVGEDYTESVLLEKLTDMRPTVDPLPEAELAAALETAQVLNRTEPHVWPMQVEEVDGRLALASSTAGISQSISAVEVILDAKAGDAIAITFKLSCEEIFDSLRISINNEQVKGFSGELDWMTYAIPVTEDGTYTVLLVYAKDDQANAGQDKVWIDTVTVLSGEAAEAALKANPAYPVSDAFSCALTNENAREIIIDERYGLLKSAFGNARYYVVNDETASFRATVSPEEDPGCAFFYSDYEEVIDRVFASCVDGEGYSFSTGLDTMETTGYPYTFVQVGRSLAEEPAFSFVLFRDEATLRTFMARNLDDMPWYYMEEAPADVLAAILLPEEAVYTLRCVDQNGQPVSGVMLQICDEDTCQVVTTNEQGEHVFTTSPYAWELHVLMAPAGYTADTTAIQYAPIAGGTVTFTLQKQ